MLEMLKCKLLTCLLIQILNLASKKFYNIDLLPVVRTPRLSLHMSTIALNDGQTLVSRTNIGTEFSTLEEAVCVTCTCVAIGRYDTQHNDTEHSDIQHNNK
jgi:hypothetical protein